jgi:hypothetical protein
VLTLILQAFDSGALEESQSNFDMCVAWKEDLRTLKEMFEKPVHQLHVDAFEHLLHNMVAPEWMGDDERDIERAKGYADRVCKDLMLFLEEHGDEDDSANPALEIVLKKEDKTVLVNGVSIDKERQEVIYRGVRSAFKLGGVPWAMVRLCAEDGADGIGKTDIDPFLKKRTKDALHRIVNRMNKPWKNVGENVFRIHNDCFCVDPQIIRK